MKKLLIALSLLLLANVPTEGLAGSVYSNARGDLVQFRNQPLDATAYVILNYIKGRGNWVVTGEAFGMAAGTYVVAVGIGGVCNESGPGDIIAMFSISSTPGDAFFHNTGVDIDAAALPDLDDDGNPDIDIIRVYPTGTSGCPTEMVATEDPFNIGDLVFRGGQRGQ